MRSRVPASVYFWLGFTSTLRAPYRRSAYSRQLYARLACDGWTDGLIYYDPDYAKNGNYDLCMWCYSFSSKIRSSPR